AGVDLGGTTIQVVAVNGTAVKGGSRTATPTTSAEDVVHEIVGSVRLAVQQAGGRLSGLDKVGIGTPGRIDGRKGVVSHSGNVVGMMDSFALGPAVSKELGGLPVVIDNDVRVAILGEYERGAGRHYKNVLGVFVGTGVGGGLVLEGKLREGRGAAGGIGHTLVDLEAVIIGGGLGDRLGKPFVDKVAEAARPHLHVPDKPPDIIPTELGDLAGAVGAAILAGG